MMGLVVHVSDLPISCLCVVKKESPIKKELFTIPVGKKFFNFKKTTLEQRSVIHFSDF